MTRNHIKNSYILENHGFIYQNNKIYEKWWTCKKSTRKDEHENTRKMMSMKIIYMRKMNIKIREERWARKESTRERWTQEYEK